MNHKSVCFAFSSPTTTTSSWKCRNSSCLSHLFFHLNNNKIVREALGYSTSFFSFCVPERASLGHALAMLTRRLTNGPLLHSSMPLICMYVFPSFLLIWCRKENIKDSLFYSSALVARLRNNIESQGNASFGERAAPRGRRKSSTTCCDPFVWSYTWKLFFSLPHAAAHIYFIWRRK